MEFLGQLIIYIIMACALLGCWGAIRDENSGIGKEFMTAFHQLGIIFIPFAGMLASMPYIQKFVMWLCGGLFEAIGADIAVAGALIMAPDMGGYQITKELASSPETWVLALFVSYCTGPIISYSIPLGFSLIDKRDRKYFGLGIMAGILSIPFAVISMLALLKWTDTPVRGIISNISPSDIHLAYSWAQIWINMVPIVIFCIVLAFLLRFFMNAMVKGFLVFGRALEITIKVILVISIVEYFTGVFSTLIPSWAFQPIIADAKDQFRALENAGYLALMLSGAYPMIYLIDKYFGRALRNLGGKCGFTTEGSIGLFATCAEQIAMFGIVRKMPPADKVKVIAFSVCASWLFGAHISITANFQPNLLAILLAGKVVGGIVAVIFSLWLAVPMAKKLEAMDRKTGVIGENEYR
ncbi:MAG TPA: ethanolamine utilization protein EutH [Sutterella sp.]|nr:ethanolamine utilization protein EutH [Sutterella sp.]